MISIIVIGLVIFIGLVVFQYTFWEADQKLAIEEIEGGAANVIHPIFEASLVERADLVHRDEQSRFHCSSGPTIIFNDMRLNRYFWHGIEVPKIWIEEPEYLTAVLALTQENIERRQAAFEIIGWDKILAELHCEIIDRDADPKIGELIETVIPGSAGRSRFLRVQCGTGRIFVLSVPPDVNTALAANAWTYDINPEIFNPEVRT